MKKECTKILIAIVVGQALVIFSATVANAQGPMTNGETKLGTISPAGETDSWTFSANAGDAIVVRVGEISNTAFTPKIQLLSPTSAVLGTSSGSSAAEIAVTATNSGTFTVIVSDNAGTQTNAYRLTLARTGDPVVVSPGDEGGPMTNGVMHTGTIGTGDLDVWTVTATAGDSVVVRMGKITDTSSGFFTPWVRIYSPNGALLGSGSGTSAGEVAVTATNTGTFLVVVGDGNSSLSGSGTYRLTLAKTGDPVVVSPGDEGGPMTNGVMHTGTIGTGDLDVWTVTATAGDSVVVRMGKITDASSGFFTPWVRIYSPGGVRLGSGFGTSAGEVAVTATNTGTFLVVVGDGNSSLSGSGTYRLTLAKTGDPVVVSPGDEGGPMTNGVMHTGTIGTGDLDVWTVIANVGESIVVRMGKITDTSSGFFTPWVRIYSPGGVRLGSGFGTSAGEVAVTATNTGTFLVVVGDGNSSLSGSGTYRLTLAKTGDPVVVSPGDEGGPMTNGVMHTGTIGTGDLDVWTVIANVGESIVVRMGKITDTSSGFFTPWVRIYSPGGVRLDSGFGTSAGEVAVTATNTGTFLVVVGDGNSSLSGSGTYRLTLAKTGDPVVVSPGDEGGPMTNGVMHTGTIGTGDLDVWTVIANVGESIVVRMGKITDTSSGFFTPWVRIYSPGGVRLDSGFGTSAGEVAVTATNTGTFLVVAGDGNSTLSGSGTYRLTLAQVPRAFVISAGDEGGTLTNGIAQPGTIVTGDLDMWSFKANTGDSISLQVSKLSGDASFAPQLNLYAPNGSLMNSVFSSTTATISNVAPSLGTYTVLVGDHSLPFAGTYQVRLDKFPPDGGASLTLGSNSTNHIGSTGDRAYFVIEVPPGGNLHISLDILNNLGSYELYAKRGAPPTSGDYDYRATVQGSADQSIFIPDADSGPWYIMIYADSVPVAGDYTIRADFTTGVTLNSITPNKLGNLGPARIAAAGAGFGNAPQVVLASGPTIVANGTVSVISKSQLEVDFNLTGVAGGTYQFTVSQGTNSASLPFEVVNGGVGKLETQLIIPGLVGRHAPSTVLVQYSNTGDAAMAAPLLVVHGSDNALMTLDSSLAAQGLWTATKPAGYSDTIQLLASGATPGILQPGESIQVPVYYAGLLQPWNFNDSSVQFDLGVFDNTNTNAVNWDSLKAGLRPSSISSDAWEAVWGNFVADVGPTWGNYAAMLSDNAIYLGKLGLNITAISSLVAFELAQADGLNPVTTLGSATDAYAREPGLSLVFGRVFPQRISQRYRLGSIGRGWSHNWEFSAYKDTNSNVIVQGPAGAQRVFQPDVRGGFFRQAGDHGTLTDLGSGRYQLTETDGMKMLFRTDGLLDYVEDLNGNRITANYTGGLLTSLNHSAGQSLLFNYSGNLLQSVTDPYGRVTTFAYDSGQHLTNATSYGTTTVYYAYSSSPGAARNHALTTVTYPGGTHDYFTYDTQGRLATTSSDGGAQQVDFSYDTAGTVFATDAYSNQSEFFFDNRGLLTKVENPLDNAARFNFDNNFNLTSVQAPDGTSSALSFDPLGNATRTLDPAGNAIAMTYTANTRLNRLTDARSQSTSFNYDAKGNALSMVYPDNTQESYIPNAQGEVINFTNRRGQTIALTRDSAGRIAHKVTPEGRTNDFFYDLHGNLTNVTDSVLGTTSLGYDSRDLLASITYPDGKGFTFQYNPAGRRTRRTGNDGYILKYFYDSVGRLEHLEDGTGRQIIQYLYDDAGRLSRENKGNNTWTTYNYDPAGQLLHLVNYGTNGVPISRFDYTYDPNGNRTSMITLAGTNSYTYDPIGQLTDVTYPNGRHVTYAYDATGNRTAVNDGGTNTTYLANNLNQYTQAGTATFSYDTDGNLTNQTDSTGATAYQFDSENRLVSISTATNGTWQYAYDAFGNRVIVTRNSQTTHYLQDPIGLVNVVAEYDNGGSLVARYDHGLGLADRVANTGVAAYYDYDALGHTRELTDPSGMIANRYDYEPFGSPLTKQESVPNPFTYVGRLGVRDDGGGLLFMRARSYSPNSGGFVSVDPVLFADSKANSYRYARGNPNILTDSSGEDSGADFSEFAQNVIDWSNSLAEGDPAAFFQGKILDYGIKVGVSSAVVGVHLWKAFGPGATARENYVRDWNALQDLNKIRALVEQDPGYLLWARAAAWSALDYAKAHDYDPELPNVFSIPEEVLQFLDHPDFLPDPPLEERNSGTSFTAHSQDPNDLIGPSGYGTPNYLRSDGAYVYRIDFENATNATAPAQVVQISNAISTNLDLSTLEFNSVGFGDYFFAIPPGSQHYEHAEEITYNGVTFDVNIEAKVDYASRQVQVNFESVIPDSGLPPSVDVGFLPPEDGTGRGMGHVAYAIHPVAGLPTSTQIRNTALVTFDPLAGGPTFATDLQDPTDPNSGTDTNRQALVTTDSVAPSSQVTALPTTSTTSFNVCWTAMDDSGGSGIQGYTIYVSDNSGPFTVWLANTNITCAAFTGSIGHTYAFYSVATDNVGNTEATPNSPEASTAIQTTALASWRQSKFTASDLANPNISGDLADPDGDGIANLMEYALNSDPKVASVTGLPTVVIQNGYLALTYVQVKTAVDIIYEPQATGAPGGPWTTNGLAETGRVDLGQTWKVTVRDSVLVSSAGQRFMRLHVTRPFDAWSSTKFTAAELTNQAVSAETADPDHDGIVNLMEYALNLDPKISSQSGLPIVTTQGNYLALTFTQMKNATDLLYEVQVADNPGGPWSSAGTVETSRIDNGTFWTVTVRDGVLISGANARFIRLRITRP